MWKIKDVKNNGKKILRGNFWTLCLVSIFMVAILGEYRLGNNSFKSFQETKEVRNEISEQIKDEESGKADKEKLKDLKKSSYGKELINNYFETIVSQYLTGNSNVINTINKYNEKNKVYKGVFYSCFNILTQGEEQLQNLVNKIVTGEAISDTGHIVILIVCSVALGIRIFVVEPIKVGEKRIYLESINYKKTKINKFLYPFKNKRYGHILWTNILTNIYKNLWALTIVGGPIKTYSYRMVPYILAENPKMKANEAITLSRNMMKRKQI